MVVGRRQFRGFLRGIFEHTSLTLGRDDLVLNNSIYTTSSDFLYIFATFSTARDSNSSWLNWPFWTTTLHVIFNFIVLSCAVIDFLTNYK